VRVFDADLQLVAVGDALPLLLDRLKTARAYAAHHELPIDPVEEILHFLGRNARSISPSNQRTHAGAGDTVDRYVHLFEHLEDADVGATLGAAAGQHQTNPRTLRVNRCCRFSADNRLCRDASSGK
jgi:hypothetical protein